jgi:hypothetical protein
MSDEADRLREELDELKRQRAVEKQAERLRVREAVREHRARRRLRERASRETPE